MGDFMYDAQITFSRIKYVLTLRRLKAYKMLNDLDLNKNFLSQSSKLLTGMSAASLYAISQYLGVSSDYLLGLSNDITIYHSSDLLTRGEMGLLSEKIEQIDDTVKIG